MTSQLKVAELLCTRLCHDLTGPIGAVNNGAEFLCEEGFNMQHQALDLITTSAHQAVARLQFYRQAYGRVNASGEASLADFKKITEEFFSGSKITLDWPDHHTDGAGISVGVKMARLLLNMIIITSATLIRGGTVRVRLEKLPEGGKTLSVTGEGPATKWEPEWDAVLAGEVELPKVTPKTVQIYLTKMLTDELDAAIEYKVQAESFSIRCTQRQILSHAPDQAAAVH